jgi:PAS domain S-box-containing protein
MRKHSSRKPPPVDFLKNETNLPNAVKDSLGSEQELQTILDNLDLGITLINPKLQIMTVNRQMKTWFPEISLGVQKKYCFEIFRPLTQAGACENCPAIKTLQNGQANSTTMIISMQDKPRHFRIKILPLKEANGGVSGFIEILEDVTPAVMTEDALTQALTRIECLLEAVPLVLVGVDQENRVTQWNTRAEALLGLSFSDVMGRPLDQCAIPWEERPILQRLPDLKLSREHPLEVKNIRFRHKDGQEGFMDLLIMAFPSVSNKGSETLLVGIDNTERTHMAGQLLQAQKLEAIGQLASGIAHEINTPIQYIGDNLRFLEESFRDLGRIIQDGSQLFARFQAQGFPSGTLEEFGHLAEGLDLEFITSEIPKAVAQSLEGVNRVAAIVKAMKSFAHPDSLAGKTLTNINQALENTVLVARNEWKYVADVQLELDPALPLVECLPGEMNQVFINVLVNAAQALAEAGGANPSSKGTITIRTRQVLDQAEIRITDNGPGIPEKIRDRVFEPFFTTKEVGKGTGQGLALAHSVVVKKHNGLIYLDTEIGKGTTFVICIPLVA